MIKIKLIGAYSQVTYVTNINWALKHKAPGLVKELTIPKFFDRIGKLGLVNTHTKISTDFLNGTYSGEFRDIHLTTFSGKINLLM
jgi:hypothetical protein